MTLFKHISIISPTLDKKDKYIFFGIPKNAQTSVNRHLLKNRTIDIKDNIKRYNHKLNSYSERDLKEIFKFTIVRNPWDRMVSTYHYLKEKKFINDKDFKTFLYNIENGLADSYHIKVKQHLVSQVPIFTINKKIIVDFVARLENIKRDWIVIAQHINCNSKLPHANRSNHEKYRRYYDKESVELVRKMYREDVELLNYKF